MAAGILAASSQLAGCSSDGWPPGQLPPGLGL